MKIIYLHQYFNTPSMAGGTRSFEMARRLVAAGHEVEMITSWREYSSEKSWFTSVEEGIKVHWLPVCYGNKESYSRRVHAFFRFAMHAGKKAVEIDGDIVFATSTPLTICIPGIWVSRRNGIPMVFEVRDLWPELPIAIGALKNPISKLLGRWMERIAYRSSKRIVALSPGMKDGIIKVGYPASQVSVIPNSSDLERFDPETVDPAPFLEEFPYLKNRIRVVYTGTFGLINGVGFLVNVAENMLKIDPKICFIVVGGGKEFESVRLLAEECGVLDNNFYMLPSVPKSEIPPILASAHMALSLFVDLKEMWANSANKFFDALASATPVAINYGGWQSELLNDWNAGLTLPVADSVKSAELLALHLNDVVWLDSASSNARSLAVSKFSRDVLAADLEKILVDCLLGTSGNLPDD